MRHIFLDSAPLGRLSHPAQSGPVIAISTWASDCLSAGHKLYIPEVIDYEIRRELLRASKNLGIAKLNSLRNYLQYVPITTAAIVLAADLWAKSRRSGRPTADPKHLDIDVILAAQALTPNAPSADIIVATTNIGHLSRFVAADLWTNI